MAENGSISPLTKQLRKLNPYAHRAYIRELLALRSRKGPYRFLVRNWVGASDIDLAVGLLKIEFFRNEMIPVPLPVTALKSILVLAPHQDDETIGAGGTLLLASNAEVRIDILYVTDGSQNKPEFLEGVRGHEAREVCSRLGAGVRELGISNIAPKPTVADVDRICALIHELRPQVVMAPWLLDSPAKHRFVDHLLWLADKREKLPDFEVWGYQVHNMPFPNGYVDITDVAEEKRKLLNSYQSQNRFRRYDHLAMGMAAWNSHILPASPEPRYVEVFLALPLCEFSRLVETFYLKDLGTTYVGDQNLARNMWQLHKEITNAAPLPLSAFPGGLASQSSGIAGFLRRILRRRYGSL